MPPKQAPIRIVDKFVIAEPRRILDFVAVASWKNGELQFSSTSVSEEGISAEDHFSLWIGLAAFILENQPPPKLEKILVSALQSLHPEFTYRAINNRK